MHSKFLFLQKKLENGKYEATPDAVLAAGEYCFMFAASSMNQGMTHKVYDFSVR